MPDPFVARIAAEVYGLSPVSIQPIELFHHEWRGIYRVEDVHGDQWVLRMLQRPATATAFAETAVILRWLATQGYPAPQVLPTTSQQLVGIYDDWVMLAVSYVPGALVRVVPGELERMAERAAQLHLLPIEHIPIPRISRCHPDTIALAANRLATHGKQLPGAFRPLAHELYKSMDILQQELPSKLCLTHGDCNHTNAIVAESGDVTLIDWDNVGPGVPLLDLGTLLLVAHFRFDEPLLIEPDAQTIQAILAGYQSLRPLNQWERGALLHAMRFLLAYQLGEYAADSSMAEHPDFPFILKKLQTRYEATQTIAEIARKSVLWL
jgi:Ser/Thr protein kinase RdoA (MazF antagonist)